MVGPVKLLAVVHRMQSGAALHHANARYASQRVAEWTAAPVPYFHRKTERKGARDLAFEVPGSPEHRDTVAIGDGPIPPLMRRNVTGLVEEVSDRQPRARALQFGRVDGAGIAPLVTLQVAPWSGTKECETAPELPQLGPNDHFK